jgi:hypothetical protein
MKPGKKKIEAEIKKLKEILPKVQPFSAFGDDNQARIRAEIRVMEEDLDEDDIFNEFPASDEDMESGSPCAGTNQSARDARQWLDGESEDGSPYENWKPLVK